MVPVAAAAPISVALVITLAGRRHAYPRDARSQARQNRKSGKQCRRGSSKALPEKLHERVFRPMTRPPVVGRLGG
jgi:hypothetical protein